MDVETRDTGATGRGEGRLSWIVRVRGSLIGAVARVCEDLTRPAMNRRVVHRLSVLSDRELKDIGLVRQDVFDAALPENGDATCFLLARREEARRRRRGLIRRGSVAEAPVGPLLAPQTSGRNP